jgi:RNA polymerase sigma-70 factor (sigma-E family)
MNADREAQFRAMAAAELAPLRRFARSLTRDPHRADDLVQGALERMYVAWPRVHQVADPGAYLRTVVVRLAISESRRPWRRERSTEVLPDSGSTCSDGTDGAPLRLDLTRALATLSIKQRAVVVLRYVEDRSVTEVAEVLGIAPGTVKRQSADAVAKLRRVLGPDFADEADDLTAAGQARADSSPGGSR